MNNKEAIEFLKNMVDRESVGFVAPQGDGDVAIWQYHVEALNMAITALQAHWIPVTERLPDEEVNVLVTDDSGGMATVGVDWGGRYTCTGEWFWYESEHVTAWCPLPEAWKGEEDGN